MSNKSKERREIEVTAEVPQQIEKTPYDNLYKNKSNPRMEVSEFSNEGSEEKQEDNEEGLGNEKKFISLSFSVNNLSNVFALISLGFTFLFAILACFNVSNILGVTRGIFFLIASLLAIASIVFAYNNSKNKMNMPLAFSVFTIFITVMVYL